MKREKRGTAIEDHNLVLKWFAYYFKSIRQMLPLFNDEEPDEDDRYFLLDLFFYGFYGLKNWRWSNVPSRERAMDFFDQRLQELTRDALDMAAAIGEAMQETTTGQQQNSIQEQNSNL